MILLIATEEEKEMEEKHKIQFTDANVLDVNLVYKDQDDVQFAGILVGLTGIHSKDEVYDRFAVSAIFDVEFIDHSGEVEILECRKVQSSNIVGLSDQSSEQLSDIEEDLESNETLWIETKELLKDLLIVAIREEMLRN